MKNIKNSIKLLAVALVGLTLTACGDDDLNTNPYNKDGVNILAFGPMPITRGETMRVTGTKLDKVREVLFPGGNQKVVETNTYIQGDFSRKGSEEMTVTIPNMCVPGKLRLVTASGDTIKSKTNITFVEEIQVESVTPNDRVHPGDTITIRGEFVWNIAQIIFANATVDAENFYQNRRDEVKVIVPMEARSGEVVYNDGAENSEDVVLIENLEVDAPVLESISKDSLDFGETLVISGQNLDLIETIDFPSVKGVEFTYNEADGTISVVVPETAVSGTIKATAASGLSVTADIKVPLATAESISPKEELKAGDKVTIVGNNLNRIKQIILPAIKEPLKVGEFTQSATTITFIVPEGMGDGKVKLVQHDNWAIETPKIAMHSDAPELTIWTGSETIGNWKGAMSGLAYGAYDWSTAKPGQVLTAYLTPNLDVEGWAQIRFGDGNWDHLAGTADSYDLTKEDKKASITLTQEMIDQMVNQKGLVLCGAYFTVTKVTLSILETVLWSGSTTLCWEPSNAVGDLAYGAFDWSKIEAGTTLKVYFEPDPEAGYRNIRFGNGSWAALPSTLALPGASADGTFSPDATDTSFKITLTAEDLKVLTEENGLVVCGHGLIIKKIVTL